MKKEEIPPTELEAFDQEVLRTPEYLDVDFVISQYTKNTRQVIEDPLSDQVITIIKNALVDRKPFSLVRFGDGEVNLLTFSKYELTPGLNYFVAQQSVNKRDHSFLVGKTSLFLLEQLMSQSLDSADVVGLLGLWRPNKFTVDQLLENKKLRLRGIIGQWRGVGYFLKSAENGSLKNKTVVSAHCYFSIIRGINTLVSNAEKVLLISNQKLALSELKKSNPKTEFNLLHLTSSDRPLKSNQPDFLLETYLRLPEDLTGVLVLIGAGPWAEIYCHWVKQKRGVAVDIGSGIDLISGVMTRPVHKKMKSLGGY